MKVEKLDGGVVRTNLSKGLGFSNEGHDTNIRRIPCDCDLLTGSGVAIPTSTSDVNCWWSRKCQVVA